MPRTISAIICEKTYEGKKLYSIYPLSQGSGTRFLAHYDNSLDAIGPSGRQIAPKTIDSVSFPDPSAGLTDQAGVQMLGNSVFINANDQLIYQADDVFDFTKGSVSSPLLIFSS